ncbi:MAG: M13 family metallopeptidase [Chitinophagaceae bacterium]
MKKTPFLFAVLFFLLGCKSTPEATALTEITGIDSSATPKNNFFMYVNRTWYDSARIPPSQSGVGAYMFMNYPQRLRLQGILDSVSKATNTEGSIEQKLGDFYASGMDTTTINQRGYEPIKPVLASIDSISDLPSMMKFAATAATLNNGSVLSFGIAPDNKNSNLNIAHVYQAGIGLPERDYYFKTDASSVAIQQAYKLFLSKLFQLTATDAGIASKNADIVYNIDKQLAAAHRTNIELRDVNANYNKMALAALVKQQPNIGWQQVLNDMGAKTDSIDVAQPAYYDKLNAVLKSIPLSDWKIYLKAYTISNYADVLSQPFVDASFELNKVISGQAVQKTRGEKMASAVDQLLGGALGQLYVKKYFPEEAKKRTLDLVNNLQKAMAARMDKLDWMSDSTKQKAKEKLLTMTKKIAYPDKWRDYNNVGIVKGKYFENIASAVANNYRFQLAKLNKAVDRSEWFVTPSTVTAYYNPSANEIVFPAAILQPPYFDNNADDALNYGGIGMVIGHEITHAFDDQGAQFDVNGNVKSWWTKDDYTKFKAKTQNVIDIYNTFTVLDTVHVKGAMTVGENAADVAGVAIAYDAFKLTKEGQDSTKIGSYTPDQRFFISVAHIWRVKMKDEFLRLWINNNPHSPPMWRVNGPLMNNPHFYEAFNITQGDSMYLPKEKRIHIW